MTYWRAIAEAPGAEKAWRMESKITRSGPRYSPRRCTKERHRRLPQRMTCVGPDVRSGRADRRSALPDLLCTQAFEVTEAVAGPEQKRGECAVIPDVNEDSCSHRLCDGAGNGKRNAYQKDHQHRAPRAAQLRRMNK